jgi:hypothetical protein
MPFFQVLINFPYDMYGLHRASYIGTAKVELAFLLSAVACNIKKAVFLPSP